MKRKRKYRIRYHDNINIIGTNICGERKIQIASKLNDVQYNIAYEQSLFDISILVQKENHWHYFVNVKEYKKGTWRYRIGCYVDNIDSKTLCTTTDYFLLKKLFDLMHDELEQSGLLIQAMMHGV